MAGSFFKRTTLMIVSEDAIRSVTLPKYFQIGFLFCFIWLCVYAVYTKLDRAVLLDDLNSQKHKAAVLESRNRALVDTIEEMDNVVNISLNYLEKTDQGENVKNLKKIIQRVEEKSKDVSASNNEDVLLTMSYTKRLYEEIRQKITGIEEIFRLFNVKPVGSGDEGGTGGALITADFGESFLVPSREIEYQIKKLSMLRKQVSRLPLGAPLQYNRISSKFGRRTDPFVKKLAIHNGVDLVAPLNTAVKATGNGKVVHAGSMGSYGNTVIIDHGNQVRTLYAHMSKIKVEKGQRIRKGDRVGIIGNTGRSTGVHLHYQIEVDGKAINPEKFLSVRTY